MLRGDVEVREQRALLGHVADAAPRRGGRVAPGPLTTWPPSAIVPASGVREACDQPQQRRLAAARGAEDRVELAGGDVEVDAVEHADGAEALRRRRWARRSVTTRVLRSAARVSR